MLATAPSRPNRATAAEPVSERLALDVGRPRRGTLLRPLVHPRKPADQLEQHRGVVTVGVRRALHLGAVEELVDQLGDGELADRLQLRHHSVVELVNRAQRQGLVERAPHLDDARAVRVLLTENGEAILTRLSALHRDELRRMELALSLPTWHDDYDRSRDASADWRS